MNRLWIVPLALLGILLGTIGVGLGAMSLLQGRSNGHSAGRQASLKDALHAYDPDISDEDIEKATEVIRTWQKQGKSKAETEAKFFDFCDHDTSNGELRDLVKCRQGFRILIAVVYDGADVE